MNTTNRRKFFTSCLTASSGLLIPTFVLANHQPTTSIIPDARRVQEFVTLAHGDFDKVKSMLTETPELLNASHSWQTWDWEDAVGAAGHMGHTVMARYLLEKGARITLCVAAMLGELDLVRSTIKSFPYMKDALGPHGISLLDHAKAGKEPAMPVVEYLQSLK